MLQLHPNKKEVEPENSNFAVTRENLVSIHLFSAFSIRVEWRNSTPQFVSSEHGNEKDYYFSQVDIDCRTTPP